MPHGLSKYDKVDELPDQPVPTAARRWFWALGAGLGLLGAGAAVYWLSVRPAAGSSLVASGPAAVNASVEALENRRREIDAELARLGKRGAEDQVRALLTEAVALQKTLVATRVSPLPEDTNRLDQWQAQLAAHQASAWLRLSEKAESAARALGPAEAAAARGKWREAWQWQQAINRSAVPANLKNLPREARLEREWQRVAAEARLAAAAAAQTRAQAALVAAQWGEAQTGFAQARELYRQLDAEFPQSGLGPPATIQAIETGLVAARTGQALAGVESFWQAAQTAAREGRVEEADRQYEAAARAQQQFNAEFPGGPGASTERLAAIESARQGLRARQLAATALELDARAAGHRRRRENFQSQQLLTEAATALEAISARYPLATGVETDLRRRVAWLQARADDLAGVQDQVYDALRALPGADGAALLRTEVGQALFARVMKQNPSRQEDFARPVESVTLAEAEEFCERLGWVLGARVRLPTVEEFKAALGEQAAGADAWGAENSPGQSQPMATKPANAAGFYDLLGNVAEWLAAGAGDQAVVAGGSYADSRAQLQRVPLNAVVKTKRAPTIGFRVVVEVVLAGPAETVSPPAP